MELYEQSISELHKMHRLKDKVFANKENKQLINEAKHTIISLAYSDYLTASDLIELSSILSVISNMKPIKNKGL